MFPGHEWTLELSAVLYAQQTSLLFARWRYSTVFAAFLSRDASHKRDLCRLDLESDFRKLASVTMLRSLTRILRASLMQIDTEMVEKYAKQQQSAVCGKFDVCQH